MPTSCRKTRNLAPTSIAGSRAVAVRFLCGDGDAAHVWSFVHGDRVFVIGSGFPAGKTEARSARALAAVIATLRFSA
jgi:hypothetical protein